MARVIVRFSLNGDTGSNVRNNGAQPALNGAGIQNTGTGTWEVAAGAPADVATALKGLIDVLFAPGAVQGAAPGVSLDHLGSTSTAEDGPNRREAAA